MNLLEEYNNRRNSIESYDNGTTVGDDLESLLAKYKEGTIGDEEKKLLISQLQEVSQSPLSTFENFQKQFFQNAITQGTDFYLNTGYKTEEDVKNAPKDKSGRMLGQYSSDILTEEGQQGIEEGDPSSRYYPGTNLVEASEKRGQYITTTGEQLFYENSAGEFIPVPDFGGDQNKKAEFMKKLAYNSKGSYPEIFDKSHVNIAGCGDNMSCITAGTNMLQNSIEAWNLAIADPNSQYYISDKKQRTNASIDANTNNMSAMSHSKFWGSVGTEKGKSEEQRYNEAGFQQNTINRDDFFIKDSDGEMILDPTAISNFFDKEMQIGNIMGIHSSGHGNIDAPAHAISYQGGMFYQGDTHDDYKKTPLDFSTDKGRTHAINFLQSQINLGINPDMIMDNIQFLGSNDPTEAGDLGLPYQYQKFNLGELFIGDKRSKNYNKTFYTTFKGDENYQNYLKNLKTKEDEYKTIYTDLTGGESSFERSPIDYQGDIPTEESDEETELSEEDLGTWGGGEEDQRETSWWSFESESEGGEGWIPDEIEESRYWPFHKKGGRVSPPSFKRGGNVGSGCSECDAKRLSQRMSPPSFNHGGEHDYSLVEGIYNQKDNPDLYEDMSALYPVEIINYPPGYSEMQSGHIESRLLSNYQGNDINLNNANFDLDNPIGINKDEEGRTYYTSNTSVNAWYDGNREITYDPTKNSNPNIRRAVVNLTPKQLENYITNATTQVNPTRGGLNQEAKEGVGLGGLIADLSKDPSGNSLVTYDKDGNRIYKGNIPIGDTGYDFMKNNCADVTCKAFGIDPNETDRILGTTTDPAEVFDYIINNDDQFNLIPNSVTGTKLQAVDENGNPIDNRQAYVQGGGDLFGIPNEFLEDLLTLESRGFNLDKLSEGTVGDILENAPNIGKKLTEDLLNFNDKWYTAEWMEDVALDAVKSIKVSNMVDVLLDPNNTDEISQIINAVKTGNFNNLDAGDLLELYINSTELGDKFDEMGWLGDYFMWREKFTADALQNTVQVGMETYNAGVNFVEEIAETATDIYEGGKTIANYVGDQITDITSEGTISPYNPDDHKITSTTTTNYNPNIRHANLARGEYTNKYGSIMLNGRMIWKHPDEPNPIREYFSLD